MKTLSVNEAAKLVKVKSGPAISLYLTTDISDRDSTPKLKGNLQRLYKTAEALIIRTYDAKLRERLLPPLKKALSMIGVRREKGGIAIYHTEEFTGMVRLPTITSDLAVAADSFHVKPVLRCLQNRRNYYLLALRKKNADLYLVTVDGTKLVESVPIRSTSEKPVHPEKVHRGIFSSKRANRPSDLAESMEFVNRQLESHWRGERAPMIIAGPRHHQEAFRESCIYMNLLETGIDGYVEELDAEALSNLSLSLMEGYFSRLDDQFVIAFRKAEASGLTTTDIHQIARAAARGQIQNLLIAEDRQIWGHLDRDTGSIEVVSQRTQATTDDLLDDLAELTINKGGGVTILSTFRMPGNQPIAAVLRWNDFPVTASVSTHIGLKKLHKFPGELRA
jgi:hypothetical protein